jgi:putative aldouronate transport system permease protein
MAQARVMSARTRTLPFDLVNGLVMVAVCVSVLYPFLYVLKQSFTGGESFADISLSLIPRGVDIQAYTKVLNNEYIGYGFLNTLKRTLVGTPLTVTVTVLAAYALSKKSFPNRTVWTGLFVFTMFFDGGLIPTYLVVKSVGLIDKLGALVIPRLVDTFTLLIVRNYMMSLPASLEESAKIDGAGDLTVLTRIVVPVSMPIIATVMLWTMVNHWNWWFDSLIYMTSPKKMVLQVVLRRIILEGTMQMMEQIGFLEESTTNPDSLKAAAVIVTTVPIVCVYPFLQKYFVRGILVGALKG